MLACDNGQLVGPDGQRAFLGPGVGAAGAGVQAVEDGLAASGEDLEAAECPAIDAQAVGVSVEREPLWRCADSDERGWAEDALGDVPSGSGGLAVLPVEVDAHHAVGAVGEPDTTVGVKAAQAEISGSVGARLLKVSQPVMAGRLVFTGLPSRSRPGGISGMIASQPIPRRREASSANIGPLPRADLADDKLGHAVPNLVRQLEDHRLALEQGTDVLGV